MYAAAEVRDEKSGERRAAAISVGPGTDDQEVVMTMVMVMVLSVL